MTPICIIVPLYNGGAWIARTLDAALAQTRAASDIVVVDDGSSDDGPQIVNQYQSVRLLKNPKKGANNARVFGLQSTDCAYVTLLDQDDRWTPTHLEKLGAILDEHTDCSAATGNNSTYTLGSEPAFPDWPEEVECYDQWSHYPFHNIASPSGVLFRRAALEEVGGWPTHIEGVADLLTYFRASAQHPIWRTTACTWSRGEHEGSYSAKLRGPGQTVNYMLRITQAVEEALAFRLKYYPKEQPKHSAALHKFATITSLLKVLDDDKPQAVQACVQDFESAYKDEPESIRLMACNGLAWMVSYAGIRPSDGKHAASYLMQHWPSDCRATGQLVRDGLKICMGKSMAWDYFRGSPLDAHRVGVLAASCSRVMRGMIDRGIPSAVKHRIRQLIR